jgi:hypothetical protein
MNQADAQLSVTVVCTAAGCEDWHFRGSADDGFDAAGEHDQDHARDQQPAGPATIIEDIPGESERERRGRIVREVWVQVAHERGDTKPSHLTPWPELDPAGRALDDRIGAALAADERARQADAARASGQRTRDALARAMGPAESDSGPLPLRRTTHAELRGELGAGQ